MPELSSRICGTLSVRSSIKASNSSRAYVSSFMSSIPFAAEAAGDEEGGTGDGSEVCEGGSDGTNNRDGVDVNDDDGDVAAAEGDRGKDLDLPEDTVVSFEMLRCVVTLPCSDRRRCDSVDITHAMISSSFFS